MCHKGCEGVVEEINVTMNECSDECAVCEWCDDACNAGDDTTDMSSGDKNRIYNIHFQ